MVAKGGVEPLWGAAPFVPGRSWPDASSPFPGSRPPPSALGGPGAWGMPPDAQPSRRGRPVRPLVRSIGAPVRGAFRPGRAGGRAAGGSAAGAPPERMRSRAERELRLRSGAPGGDRPAGPAAPGAGCGGTSSRRAPASARSPSRTAVVGDRVQEHDLHHAAVGALAPGPEPGCARAGRGVAAARGGTASPPAAGHVPGVHRRGPDDRALDRAARGPTAVASKQHHHDAPTDDDHGAADHIHHRAAHHDHLAPAAPEPGLDGRGSASSVFPTNEFPASASIGAPASPSRRRVPPPATAPTAA